MIISDMCNFCVGRFIMMQTFSAMIFVNCILHVSVVDLNLETSDLFCKFYKLEHLLVDLFIGWIIEFYLLATYSFQR